MRVRPPLRSLAHKKPFFENFRGPLMMFFLKFNIKKFSCLTIQFISKIIPSFEIQKSDFIYLICKLNVILETLFVFKSSTNFQFKCLIDIAGLDFIRNDFRLAVSYNLLSVRFNQRVRVVTLLGALDVLSSVIRVFECSNWLEREAWDLYGIFFRHHPDLRRILTDYGFEGHPLRKDYPLEGFSEGSYSLVCERVVQKLLSFTSSLKINSL